MFLSEKQCRSLCRTARRNANDPKKTKTYCSRRLCDSQIPAGVDKSNPLRVFFLGGQSHCVGHSSVEIFNNDTKYEEFQGLQENVWYAGIKKKFTDPSRFFMRPLTPGEGSAFSLRFGPEVSLGKRISVALDAPVLIVKYCVGGTSLWWKWNPATATNSWDRDKDDGTAQYLKGRTNFTNTNFMYVNFVHTARQALELLNNEGVPYDLSGLFWLQSYSDKRRTWQEYGNDTITLFNTIRSDLGVPNLPVVDSWDVHKHDTHTGKAYAASIVNQCNVVVTDWSLEVDDPDKSDSWPSWNGTFFNYDVFECYGYDRKFFLEKYSHLKPQGSTNKTFYWFRDSNRHLEYEGAILQGKMMANTFLSAFTNVTLPLEWIREDISTQFPLKKCDHNINGGKPSAGNPCWMDLRPKDDLADATCTTTQPTDAPIAPTDASVAPTDAPVAAPTDTPATPTDASVAPTDSPVAAPTDAPIDPVAAPTDAPVTPTGSPPTNAPVNPTDAPSVAPTDSPVAAPTGAPIDPVAAPTDAPAPAPPTDAPVNPTDAPAAAPTDTPVASTDAPVSLTDAPATAPS